MNRRTVLPVVLLATLLLALVAGLVGLSGGSGSAATVAARRDPSAAPTPSTPPNPTYYDVPMGGTPYAANPRNPLAGGTWSVNQGYWDQGLFSAWEHASGTDKTYLAKSALQPKALWFTIGNSSPARHSTAVSSYIALEQHGDPNMLVQLAVFGIWGYRGEGQRLVSPLTAQEKTDYRAWIRSVSTQIGTSRVAVILEPDLALAVNRLDLPKEQRTQGWKARQKLTAYAAKTFHDNNRHAAVYLDAGDADWLTTAQAVDLLQRSGIQYARGFALGATHYSSTQDDIARSAELASALAAHGVRSHAVIDTADNGRAFTYQQFYAAHPKSFFDNSFPCAPSKVTVCNALGVAPTWKVTSTALPLTTSQKATAATYVDGYLWFGRPWLKDQATPFVKKKAILAGQYSPF